jgi:hypothetical protein
VKRFLTVVAGVVLGAGILGAGALALLWLFCDNSVQIDLRNDSGVSLHKVAVTLPAYAFSPSPEDMEPGGGSIFSAGDMKPRTTLPIRVTFDAAGRHYDVPSQLRLAPFGSYHVSIRIDGQMQVSCKARSV